MSWDQPQVDTGGTFTFIFQSQRLLFAFERSSVGAGIHVHCISSSHKYSACKLSKNGIRAAELLKIITRGFCFFYIDSRISRIWQTYFDTQNAKIWEQCVCVSKMTCRNMCEMVEVSLAWRWSLEWQLNHSTWSVCVWVFVRFIACEMKMGVRWCREEGATRSWDNQPLINSTRKHIHTLAVLDLR